MTAAVTRMIAIAALLAVSARSAAADVWNDAARGKPGEDVDAIYAAQMEHADEQAIAANQKTLLSGTKSGSYDVSRVSTSLIETKLDDAISAYKLAATARPTEAEPYARIAKLIFSFYFEDCGDTQRQTLDISPSPFCDRSFTRKATRVRAQQLIDAWDDVEARAPLFPELTTCPYPGHSDCLLFERAILNTRIAGASSLEAATRDYRRAITLAAPDANLDIVLNNLAETFMMAGDLDQAIETYRLALLKGADASTAYGLAVALDRDGEAFEANQVLSDLGEPAYEEFVEKMRRGDVFFVPDGEVYYYVALATETFGDPLAATQLWEKYIRSGAHPTFQPRAQAHIDALRLKLRFRSTLLGAPAQASPH